MKMCAQRKAGRGQRAKELRLPSVPFPWSDVRSDAVHHRSLAFRARLYHAKNEAPEEEADFRPCDVTPRRGPMTSWAPAHVQTLSQPHSSSKGRELTRDWERAYYSYLHVIVKESVWYAETNKIYTRKNRKYEPKSNFTRTSFFLQC